MGYTMKVRSYESCSCKMVCRCTLGPAEPDQTWCSSASVVDVLDGEAEGVRLTGCKIAMAFQLPGDFFSGIDKAKLYFDEGVSDDQRTHLEAIFRGDRGGLWEGMKEAIKEWLPSDSVKIQITDGDETSITVGSAGSLSLKPLLTESGEQAKLVNAPVAAAFGITEMPLATADGSEWNDPALRSWQTLGFGSITEVTWTS